MTLQEQVDALKLEVRELRALLTEHGISPRLGPQPRSEEEVQAQIDKFVESVKSAVVEAVVLPVDRSNQCTTNGRSVEEVRANQTNETGQHDGYIVLCSEERAKGFVRPYRDKYKHVGKRPKYPTRPLTEEQERLFGGNGYVLFEVYPDGVHGSATGRFWTDTELKSGCGTVTSMGRALSETYARDPKFYGATFCVGCNRHLPVAEFVWTADGQEVGS